MAIRDRTKSWNWKQLLAKAERLFISEYSDAFAYCFHDGVVP